MWKRAQTPIKEHAMANALAKTVKAIEARNYQPGQAQS